jgi:hypothetical protein
MKSRVLIVAVTVATLAGVTWLVTRFVARRRRAAPTEWQEVEPVEQPGEPGSEEKPDPVEEAIAESFPASDPPSWTSGR